MFEKLLSFVLEKITDTKPGIITSFIFFLVAILLCIFGFYKTLFIIFFTIVGFFVGAFLFNDGSRFKDFLDRILPPGRMR